MSRSLLELARPARTAEVALIWRSHLWIRWSHIAVLLAIGRCRTASLGGCLDACTPLRSSQEPSPLGNEPSSYTTWHGYSKPRFGGVEQAVRYLGHSTHHVAISNHRLVSCL